MYGRLLLLYLSENEVMLAKFLWKRVPEESRISDPALSKAWEVGRAMAERDPQRLHKAIQADWPDNYRPYVDRLRGEAMDTWKL